MYLKNRIFHKFLPVNVNKFSRIFVCENYLFKHEWNLEFWIIKKFVGFKYFSLDMQSRMYTGIVLCLYNMLQNVRRCKYVFWKKLFSTYCFKKKKRTRSSEIVILLFFSCERLKLKYDWQTDKQINLQVTDGFWSLVCLITFIYLFIYMQVKVATDSMYKQDSNNNPAELIHRRYTKRG